MASRQPQTHFYHYSPADKLQYVRDGGYYGGTDGGSNGLLPLKRFVNLGVASGTGLPPKANDGAVFGLLKRVPKGWATHEWGEQDLPIFETVLQDMRSEKLALLKVTVDPAVDDIHIAEHGVHLAPDYKGAYFADDAGTVKAKHAYFNSLVGWDDYHARGMDYVLPEVVCFTRIPPERVEVLSIRPRHSVINDFRKVGGYTPVSRPKRPNKRTQAKLMRQLLGL